MAINYIKCDMAVDNIPFKFSIAPPLFTTWNVILSILFFFLMPTINTKL